MIPFNTNLIATKTDWIISNPKTVVTSIPEIFTIDNTAGEAHACALLEVDFVEGRKYVCECEVVIKAEVKAETKVKAEEEFLGILIFAEDANSGYGLLVNQEKEIMLGSMYEGEMLDLWFGHYKLNSSGIIKLRFEAEEVLWKCYVQDELAYATNARFHIGKLAGLYCAQGMRMEVTKFVFTEQSSTSRCGLPSESELHNELRKVIDAAPDDFVSMEGAFSHESSDSQYWQVKDINLPGAQDLYLQRGGINQPYRIGRNFMISFTCAVQSDRLGGLELFTRIVNAVDSLKPGSGIMHYLGTKEDISPTFLKSVAYENEITHPSLGNVSTLVQCDFTILNDEYHTFIQINLRA